MRASQDVRRSASKSPKQTSHQTFYPLSTVRCDGPAVFRSQIARDVACLLDVDPEVSAWTCMPSAVDNNGRPYVPDFAVYRAGGNPYFLDAPDRAGGTASLLGQAVGHKELAMIRMSSDELRSGFRLANARDLLRYGNYKTPLADRLRLLAALDEHGSLTLAECLTAFQETKPVPGLASLILNRFIEADLDEAPLGPETTIRRRR